MAEQDYGHALGKAGERLGRIRSGIPAPGRRRVGNAGKGKASAWPLEHDMFVAQPAHARRHGLPEGGPARAYPLSLGGV